MVLAKLGTWQLAAMSTAAFGALNFGSVFVLRKWFGALLARVREKDTEVIDWKIACRITAMLHAVGVCFLGIRRLATPGLRWQWLGRNALGDARILAFSLGFFVQVSAAAAATPCVSVLCSALHPTACVWAKSPAKDVADHMDDRTSCTSR